MEVNIMKRTLAFTFILALFPLAATAASRHSAQVQLLDSVTVGSTDLPKGNYKIVWSGTESNAQVTFSNGKLSKIVPARILETRNDTEAQLTTAKGGTKLLTGLELHNVTLVFANGTQAGE
jgi:hypothetical protein